MSLVTYVLLVTWVKQAADLIDWSWLSRLLPEVAIVLIFVWFTDRRDAKAAEKESELNRQRIQERQERDKEWRDFLKEERSWREASLVRLTEKIDSVAQGVSSVHSLLVSHDTWEHITFQEMKGGYKKEG